MGDTMTEEERDQEDEMNLLRKEIERLRHLLEENRIDPDRCGMFPVGQSGHREQCGKKHGHEGRCVWGGGD